MPKDRQDDLKNKSTTKKSKNIRNASVNSIETFLKKQKSVTTELRGNLQNTISDGRQLSSLIVEKNKCIAELEKGVQERDEEIQKLNNNLQLTKEKNQKAILDLAFVQEKFYQLEAGYDKIRKMQQHEIDELKAQLEKQLSFENQKLQELSAINNELQQQLRIEKQSAANSNNKILELTQSFDQMKKEFGRQQNDFECYKKQVLEEKNIYDERYKLEIAKLNDELILKAEILKQCLLDKQNLEKDKNLKIDQLNNKIRRIERAMSQPTKAVQPMPNNFNNITNDAKDNQNDSENSIDNVAFTRPQVREPLMKNNQSPVRVSANNENQIPLMQNQQSPLQVSAKNENKIPAENNMPQRMEKFKRPTQPTSTQNTSTSSSFANRKRRTQPVRQQAANFNLPKTANINEFSTSTDDDSDDDIFFQRQWRPNRECIVPETSDASEGFVKTKRSKK